MNAMARRILPLVALAISLVPLGLVGPRAARAASEPPVPPGLGIRLLEAPVARADDPRARVYIVDHLAPGTTIQRKIEISNGTGHAAHILLYASAARISDGSFNVENGQVENELTTWTRIDPGSVDLPNEGRATIEVTIAVPAHASSGERYAAVLAELPPESKGPGVHVASRVGIRVYLDVSSGGEPPSDFAITTLTAERDPSGDPVVRANIKNTGGRALDMSGQLWLKNGPGGLNAGPFPAQLGTTLGIGQEEPVIVRLDKQVPAGPWLAHLEMQSGLIKHAAEATITFPTQAGTVGKTVKAKAVPLTKNKQVLGIVAGSIIGLVLVGILIFLFLLWKRRGEDEDDDKRHSGSPNIPQSRAKESLRNRVRR